MNKWYGSTLDGEPTTQWPQIHQACAKHKRFVVSVEPYNEEREATNLQFAYLHAVVFPALAKEWDTSKEDAEFECKKRWGEEWLIKKELGYRFVLSKTTLTAKQCAQWIDNIWQGAHREGIIIPPPDPEWRETARRLAASRCGTEKEALRPEIVEI